MLFVCHKAKFPFVVSWERHGLRRVMTEIIEHRLSDRGSSLRDQADVAIIKKYTSPELNMRP